MPWSPVHVASGSHGDDDGLGRNPWTDATGHSSSLVADPDSQFSSAKDSIRQRRTLRHIRSQTTTGDPLCSPSDLSDGSQDGRERRGGSLDLHETRPSLKRAINTSRKTFDTARPVNDGGRTRRGENSAAQAEEEVIVHQIQPGDSLPGIALKYHVSLATLRNTNKLWANDTIHLRQVLYIPTQAIASSKTNSVSHLSRGRPEYPTHSNHFTPEVQTGTFPRRGHDSAAPNTISTGNTSATIKRVPLSELSFFPPSSTSALSPPSEPKSLTIPPKSNHTGIPPPSSFNNFSIRGASTFGLANLLNGAKDEIISRLSFDSTRGSSDAASEERHDVELEIVRGPRRARRRGSVTDDDDRDGEWISQPANGVAFAMHSVAEQDSVILNTPRKPKVIRTVQLQPSPTMVIPASGL